MLDAAQGSVRSSNQVNACVFPLQRSLNAGIRTVGAGSIAGTAAVPFTWCVPVQRITPCMRMGRDVFKQVKQGQLGVTWGKEQICRHCLFLFTSCRRATNAAATAACN